MKRRFMLFIVVIILGTLSSCSNKNKDIAYPKSDINEDFLKGTFKGEFGGADVYFTFKEGHKLELKVAQGDATIIEITTGGKYEIVKKDNNAEMLILSGKTDNDTVVLLLSSILNIRGTNQYNEADIFTKVYADTGLKSSNALFSDVVKLLREFNNKGQSGYKFKDLGSKSTAYASFPVVISSAFTNNGKHGLNLKFVPAWAFFGKTIQDTTTALKTNKNFNISGSSLTGSVPDFDIDSSRYLIE